MIATPGNRLDRLLEISLRRETLQPLLLLNVRIALRDRRPLADEI